MPSQLGWTRPLQVLGDLTVQRRALGWTHSQVQRLAHQVVRERTSHNHARIGRFDEQGRNVGLAPPGDTRQDADMRRTDHAGHLEQLERFLTQPSEPVLEDLPYGWRNSPCWRTAAQLESRNLGTEERIAAGAPMHFIDVVLAGFDADDVFHQGSCRVPVETGQRKTPYSG